MGLLDAVAGALGAAQGGGGAGGGQAALVQALMGLLSQGGGGSGALGALVQQFQRGGLGDVVASWVSTGQNLPISPDQLQQVLGSDFVAQIAGRFGLDPQQAGQHLAQVLPQVVDQLTPDGALPAGGADTGGGLDLGDLGALLGRFR